MSKITREEAIRRTDIITEALIRDGLVSVDNDGIMHPTETGMTKALEHLREVFIDVHGKLYSKDVLNDMLKIDLARFTVDVMKNMTCVQVLVECYGLASGYIKKGYEDT